MITGFIVYTVDVLNLPSSRAESFCERLKDKLKDNKPEGWKFIVQPVRNQGNKIQVFTDSDESAQEILPFVLESKKLVKIHKNQTPESVKDYVRMMIGAPVFKLTENVELLIENAVDRAFYYDVNRKCDFVMEEIESHVFKNDKGEMDVEFEEDSEGEDEL